MDVYGTHTPGLWQPCWPIAVNLKLHEMNPKLTPRNDGTEIQRVLLKPFAGASSDCCCNVLLLSLSRLASLPIGSRKKAAEASTKLTLAAGS